MGRSQVDGEVEERRLGTGDLFTFGRIAMARAFVVNRVMISRAGVLSFLSCVLNVLENY